MAEDYYEVLGIRPNATDTEIELAFKGRRSQYHPDRYGGTDAETLAWATACMQAVNQAYRVLSDPARRRNFDADRRAQQDTARPSSSDRSREHARRAPPPPPPPTSSLPDQPRILDYLADIDLNREDADRFHLAPAIPAKKLSAALSRRRFAHSAPSSAVHLLVDDTVFRGGADGLLITDRYVSFKSLFTDPEDYSYAGAGGWQGGFQAHKAKILRMGKECVSFTCFSASGVQQLVWAINSYLADRQQWHLQMAEDGDVDSQFFLSGSHDDKEIAMHWLIQAAENGHVSAQHNLGVSLISSDLERAYTWLVKAARQGSSLSRDRLKSPKFSHLRPP